MNGAMGQPVSRLDGHAKVTGSARYTADTPIDGVQHAVLVPSTIPHGSVDAIDTATAETSPGVLKVLTHLNTPRLRPVTVPVAQAFMPLQTDRIEYEGQPVAIVVADTLENATHAATQVAVRYRPAPFHTDFRTALARAATVPSFFEPDSRTGDPDAALARRSGWNGRTARPTVITIRWNHPPPLRNGAPTAVCWCTTACRVSPSIAWSWPWPSGWIRPRCG